MRGQPRVRTEKLPVHNEALDGGMSPGRRPCRKMIIRQLEPKAMQIRKQHRIKCRQPPMIVKATRFIAADWKALKGKRHSIPKK